MSDEHLADIAQMILGQGYRQMIGIAESMKDFSDDAIGVFDPDTQAITVAEFLFAWAEAVLERADNKEEAGE